MRGTVSSLHSYPVKSGSAVDLEAAEVIQSGFEWDRHWMLINEKGRFVSQRQLPAIARLSAIVSDRRLTLSYPGHPSLTIPTDSNGRGEPIAATMHRRDEQIQVVDEGGSVSAWLEAIFANATKANSLRLVKISDSFTRSIPDYPSSTDKTVHLADGYPYLVTSTASLTRLNETFLEKDSFLTPLEMERFRPNIVLDLNEPWIEMMAGLELRIGGTWFQLAKPCQRCGIPQINPGSGQRDVDIRLHDILKELNPSPGKASNDFGQNAIPIKGIGETIEVGMQVELTQADIR